MGHEVVTSLVCGTLSPFAIFIHPRIVITCYARCRMPACMLHEPRVIKPPTDDDFFSKSNRRRCHRHSTVKACPTSRLSANVLRQRTDFSRFENDSNGCTDFTVSRVTRICRTYHPFVPTDNKEHVLAFVGNLKV